jgi:hypothetical protein
MKTTLEIPDELLIAAKKRSAETRRSLRSLVEEGLRAILAKRSPQESSKRKPIRWVTAPGGLPTEFDVSDRAAMQEWIKRQQK